MGRRKLMIMSTTIGMMVGLAIGTSQAAMAVGSPTALADPRPSPVSSVQVKGDRLVVIAGRGSLSFDGVYEAPGGSSVEFEEGRPVAYIGKDGRKAEVDGVKIQGEKVVLVGGSSEMLLAEGKYERQGDPEPQPRDPEPQPRPNPNGFEVHDGAISKIW